MRPLGRLLQIQSQMSSMYGSKMLADVTKDEYYKITCTSIEMSSGAQCLRTGTKYKGAVFNK